MKPAPPVEIRRAFTPPPLVRAAAIMNRVPIVTTLTGGMAAARGIAAIKRDGWEVTPLQSYHGRKSE